MSSDDQKSTDELQTVIVHSIPTTVQPMRLTKNNSRSVHRKTLNKAQGQTLQNVALYFPNSVFGLYVALSRVRHQNMTRQG